MITLFDEFIVIISDDPNETEFNGDYIDKIILDILILNLNPLFEVRMPNKDVWRIADIFK